jgi:hypothetical protein
MHPGHIGTLQSGLPFRHTEGDGIAIPRELQMPDSILLDNDAGDIYY